VTSAPHLTAEVLSALLDDALSSSERAEAEAHLAACPGCAADLAQARAALDRVRDFAARDALPDAAFDARVRAALDREDARARTPASGRPRALRVGAALAALAACVWLLLPRSEALPDALASRVIALAARDANAGDARTVEARLDAAGLGFPTRVLDLGMMGWRVTGGGPAHIESLHVAEVVYRDEARRALLCVMLAARASELPDRTERFRANGIDFFVFERGGVTLVAWQEGEVLCLLAGALPTSEVRSLAVAKAMLPARS
jgi:anti-sigma factor RsiW